MIPLCLHSKFQNANLMNVRFNLKKSLSIKINLPLTLKQIFNLSEMKMFAGGKPIWHKKESNRLLYGQKIFLMRDAGYLHIFLLLQWFETHLPQGLVRQKLFGEGYQPPQNCITLLNCTALKY